MKTRNKVLVVVLLIALVLAAACNGTAANVATDTAATENASGGLNQATKLALGILKLEDSEQALTVEQAEQMITLWQAYQALGNSETTASAELEALVNQIETTLTVTQVDAINSLGLTSESMSEVMQGLGMEFGPGAMPELQGTPAAGSGFEGFQGREMPEGGFPGGGVPGGDMRAGGGEMPSEGGMAGAMGLQGTPGAMDQNRFNALGSQVNPMLLRVLIQVLEAKLEAAP